MLLRVLAAAFVLTNAAVADGSYGRGRHDAPFSWTGFYLGGNANLSLKLKYLRHDLGGDALSAPVVLPTLSPYSATASSMFDTIRTGFNYRFAEDPSAQVVKPRGRLGSSTC